MSCLGNPERVCETRIVLPIPLSGWTFGEKACHPEPMRVWLTNIVNQATSRHRRQANKKDGTLLFRNRFDCGERSVPSCKHCTTPRAAIYGGSCACIPSGASAN